MQRLTVGPSKPPALQLVRVLVTSDSGIEKRGVFKDHDHVGTRWLWCWSRKELAASIPALLPLAFMRADAALTDVHVVCLFSAFSWGC